MAAPRKRVPSFYTRPRQPQSGTNENWPSALYLAGGCDPLVTVTKYSHLVELSLYGEAFDLPPVLIGALAHIVLSTRHVGDPLCALVVGDDGVGEATLPLIVPNKRLLRRNSENRRHGGQGGKYSDCSSYRLEMSRLGLRNAHLSPTNASVAERSA